MCINDGHGNQDAIANNQKNRSKRQRQKAIHGRLGKRPVPNQQNQSAQAEKIVVGLREIDTGSCKLTAGFCAIDSCHSFPLKTSNINNKSARVKRNIGAEFAHNRVAFEADSSIFSA